MIAYISEFLEDKLGFSIEEAEVDGIKVSPIEVFDWMQEYCNLLIGLINENVEVSRDGIIVENSILQFKDYLE